MAEVMTLRKFKCMCIENRNKSLRLLKEAQENIVKGQKLRARYPELTAKLKEGEW